MTREDIRDRYIHDAIEHGTASNEEGDSKKANRAYDRMMKILTTEIRREPDRGTALLEELLSHENPYVRYASATDLLPLNEARATAVLTELCQITGPPSFDAKMVLKEWQAGRLKIP